MRLVKAGYEIYAASFIENLPYNYDGNNLIEIAGRTCYKSEEKIAEGSADKFVKMLEEKGHTAMIEHSWELRYYSTINLPRYEYLNYLQIFYVGTLVAGNLRAFEEWEYKGKNDYVKDTKFLKYIYNDKRWDMLSATVKFVCDTGVTHEAVRHRPPAFAQESTRYCNYSKDKFGIN